MATDRYWNPCPVCDCDAERIEMVRELRTALGMFSGAMPVTPKEAWDEAIAHVRSSPNYGAATEALDLWIERRGVPDEHVARAVVNAALGVPDGD